MRHAEAGFTAVLVTLFTLLIIAVLMTTTSISGWRSRNDVTREYQGYQAFLAADSGLSSFIARLKESGFGGQLGAVACWVQGVDIGGAACSTPAQLGTLYLSGDTVAGPRVDVRVMTLNGADSTVTVQAVGRFGSSSRAATSTLTQNIKITRPVFMNFSPPAALTSCPDIGGGGTARLGGRAMSYDGVIYGVTSISAASPSSVTGGMASGTGSTSGWPATLTVGSSLHLAAGSFLRIGAQGYRVGAVISGTQVTIMPSNPARLPPVGSPLTGSLDVVSIAVRGAVTGFGSYRIPISDPTSIYPNDVLYFDSGGSAYGLSVVGKGYINGDTDQGYVDVTLGATGAGAFTYSSSGSVVGAVLPATGSQVSGLEPGTPLRRYVAGGTSRHAVQGVPGGVVPSGAWSGSSTVSPAATAGNPTVGCGDALFTQVFNGMTKAGFHGLTPAANRLSAITRPLKPDLHWLGPPPGSAPGHFTLNSNDLCGYGILVVHGDLKMQGTGSLNAAETECTASGSPGKPRGFTGVIYVTGSFTSSGNSVINGALVIEGSPGKNETSLGGSMEIQYDPLAVLMSARTLSPLRYSYADGSWGQR